MRLILLLLAAVGLSADPGTTFEYDAAKPLDLKTVGTKIQDGIEVRDITFASLTGTPTPAYLVLPRQASNRAAILFIHWYEPPTPTSNRTQFVNEAVQLAKLGVISLLPATPWSEPQWFTRRSRSEDLANSIQEVKELRRAMDALLSQPGIDAARVAVVGHDFGAMYGAILANVDRRAKFYALQAGTGRFHYWYLLGPPMPEAERGKFIEQLKLIDPVEHISQAARPPVLFQFGKDDKFVPIDKAEEFIAAAGDGSTVFWYNAQHGLNQEAVRDRVLWLKKVLGL